MSRIDKPLTPRTEAFIRAVVAGKSQADAYREAYPASIKWKLEALYVAASKLMADPRVSVRVAAGMKAAAERAEVTAADVLREAMRLARFDIRKLYRPDGSPVPIHELDDATAAAIQGVDIHEEYEGFGEARRFVGYTKKYKVADKNAALEKLFKHFGLYERDNEQKTNPLAELAAALSGAVLGPVVELLPAAKGDDDDDEEDDDE